MSFGSGDDSYMDELDRAKSQLSFSFTLVVCSGVGKVYKRGGLGIVFCTSF
jgi:hypothetical protein